LYKRIGGKNSLSYIAEIFLISELCLKQSAYIFSPHSDLEKNYEEINLVGPGDDNGFNQRPGIRR
jgi:hypothetical protein